MEMEFLNGISPVVEVSGHKFESSQSCIVCISTLIFPFLQNDIHEQTRVFLFRGFFCKDFENQRRIWVSLKSAMQQKGL